MTSRDTTPMPPSSSSSSTSAQHPSPLGGAPSTPLPLPYVLDTSFASASTASSVSSASSASSAGSTGPAAHRHTRHARMPSILPKFRILPPTPEDGEGEDDFSFTPESRSGSCVGWSSKRIGGSGSGGSPTSPTPTPPPHSLTMREEEEEYDRLAEQGERIILHHRPDDAFQHHFLPYYSSLSPPSPSTTPYSYAHAQGTSTPLYRTLKWPTVKPPWTPPKRSTPPSPPFHNYDTEDDTPPESPLPANIHLCTGISPSKDTRDEMARPRLPRVIEGHRKEGSGEGMRRVQGGSRSSETPSAERGRAESECHVLSPPWSPSSEFSPSLVTPHTGESTAQFAEPLTWVEEVEIDRVESDDHETKDQTTVLELKDVGRESDNGIGVDADVDTVDQLSVLRWEIAKLRFERDEIRNHEMGMSLALQALNKHADHLVATLDPVRVSRSLVDLCGIFPRLDAHGTAFHHSLDALARTVGTRSSDSCDPAQLPTDLAMEEMMARTAQILLRSFDPAPTDDLPNTPSALDGYLPPNELWLFVHTAHGPLVRTLRETLEHMLDSCMGSRKGVVIRLLLEEMTEGRLAGREEEGTKWKWWAMKQRIKYESAGRTLATSIATHSNSGDSEESEAKAKNTKVEDEGGDEKREGADLRRAGWGMIKRFLPKSPEEEWDEAF